MRAAVRIPLLFLASVPIACRGDADPGPAEPAPVPAPQVSEDVETRVSSPATDNPIAEPKDDAEDPRVRRDPWPEVEAPRFPKNRVVPSMERKAEQGLSEALIRVERALIAPAEAGAEEASLRARASLARMRFAGTITAVDEAGNFLFDTLGRTGDATGTEDEPSLFASLHAAQHGVRSGRDSTPLHGTELTGPWGLAWTTVAENGWLLCVRVEGEE